MRGNTLVNVRTMVKAEANQSLSVGTQRDSAFNQMIGDMQTWLSGEYDWPFLDDHWTVNSALGTAARYTNVPTTADISGANMPINFERPLRMQVKWNQSWQDVDYGINEDEYNYVDSDTGETQDPVQRWQMAGQGQYELWPLPQSANIIRFYGQRTVIPVTSASADATIVDLDDLLLAYALAPNITKKPEMPYVFSVAAQQRLARLRGSYPNRTRDYIVGGSGDRGATRIVPMRIVAVHG